MPDGVNHKIRYWTYRIIIEHPVNLKMKIQNSSVLKYTPLTASIFKSR